MSEKMETPHDNVIRPDRVLLATDGSRGLGTRHSRQASLPTSRGGPEPGFTSRTRGATTSRG
jgi:hypothetical protein